MITLPKGVAATPASPHVPPRCSAANVRWTLALALTLASACADDSDGDGDDETTAAAGTTTTTTTTTGTGTSTGGSTDTGMGTDTGSTDAMQFALASTLFGAEGRSTFIITTPSLSADAVIDYGKALQIAGGARIGGLPGTGEVFVTHAEELALVKYSVSADGSFTDLGRLGLSAAGTPRLDGEHESIEVISDTKGYVFDGFGYQIVKFDPTGMTITGQISLEGLFRDGWTMLFSPSGAFHRGNEIIMLVSWMDLSAPLLAPETALVILDTTTDTVSITTDTRCGCDYFYAASSGDVYFAADPYYASLHHLSPTSAPPACLLRLRAGEPTIDPTYHVVLTDLTQGALAGGIIGGPGTTAYLKVYDEVLAPIASDALYYEVAATPAWQWWRIELATGLPGTPVAFPEVGHGAVATFGIDGQLFSNVSEGDLSASTLLDTNSGAEPLPGLVVQGIPFTGLRVH